MSWESSESVKVYREGVERNHLQNNPSILINIGSHEQKSGQDLPTHSLSSDIHR